MWEFKVKGCFLPSSKDFLTLSDQGMTALSLAKQNSKKTYFDREGSPRMLHSLQKCNYLKTDETNLLVFKYGDHNDVII